MQAVNSLPSALLIGMQRAGTTFLRQYFEIHPQIAWGRDAIFFMTDEFEKNPKAYLSFERAPLPKSQIYIDTYEALAVGYSQPGPKSWGEFDLIPGYSTDSKRFLERREIPSRIYSLLPDVKIVLTIRNQVSWLRSNYMHHLNLLPPNQRRFKDFLSTIEGQRLLYAGFYTEIISAYREIFGSANVHVMLLEQIEREQDQALAALCEFLEVEKFPYPAATQRRNTGRSAAYRNLLLFTDKLGIPQASLRKLKPLKALAGWFEKKSYSSFSKRESELLYFFYAVENIRLAKLLDIDLRRYNYFASG